MSEGREREEEQRWSFSLISLELQKFEERPKFKDSCRDVNRETLISLGET